MLDVIRIITETFHHYYPQEVGSKRGRPDDDKCAGKRKRQRTEDEEEDEDEEVEEEEEFEGCYVLEGRGIVMRWSLCLTSCKKNQIHKFNFFLNNKK